MLKPPQRKPPLVTEAQRNALEAYAPNSPFLLIRLSAISGATIELYDNEHSLSVFKRVEGRRWVTYCRDHNEAHYHARLADARFHMQSPAWCSFCQLEIDRYEAAMILSTIRDERANEEHQQQDTKEGGTGKSDEWHRITV